MAHKLSFLLMGPPRSGTTAVAQAINCHPLIFCGVEVFRAGDRHENISFPKSFHERLLRIPGDGHQLLKPLLEVKCHTASIIGNKEPCYDLAVRQLTRSLPHLKLIFMYRDPRQFVSSWNRRSASPFDKSWHPGRRGIFGFLSLLNYLMGLQEIRTECRVVPYNAFCSNVAGITTQVIRHLGANDPVSLADQSAIAKLQLTADSLRDRPREALGNESHFFDAVTLPKLNNIFDRDSMFSFADVRKQSDDYVRSLRGNWGQQFVESLVGYEDPNAILYFRRSMRHPIIAKIFAEEAALSYKLKKYLRLLPWGLKLRRMFLGQNDLSPFERYTQRVKSYAQPEVHILNPVRSTSRRRA